ncbi:MAG TPA: cysteine desulfurase family protein [Polyangiaceae bacterium]|nr:cysteine desulfurase family protein [Polyangiaceae bacterium]
MQTAHVYLDWNATTPIHPDVIEEMTECARKCWGNPSSVHWYGRLARERIEQARAELGQYFGAHPRDVLFVSGGTEANNLALLDAPALVTSLLEHPSVTHAARELVRRGRVVRWLKINASGTIDVASLAECLEGMPPGTVVAVQAVNHETGVIQPLPEVAEITRNRNAWLHVDSVQALGCLPPDTFAQGDSFSIAAHKIRGPKGIGALLWRCGRRAPTPLFFGGSQQRGLRPGTPDPVACVGFHAAFRGAMKKLGERNRLTAMRDRLELQVRSCAETNTGAAPRVGHVSSLFVPGWRGDELVAALDVEGICVSSGSACSAGTAEPSPVILAMHGPERALGTIRISIGECTTDSDVDRACSALQRITSRSSV